jgi:homoserine dehydrogenase
MKPLKLALLGFGNVNQAFCTLLNEKKLWIEETYAFQPIITVITTLDQGNLVNSTGINIERALYEFKKEKNFNPANPDYTLDDTLSCMDCTPFDIAVEATTLNIFTGEPAISHIKKAFDKKSHVISVNKGPLALQGQSLKRHAIFNNLCFFYEGTVMDGFPIFNYVDKCLPGCKILGFEGIFNSTTNYIIGKMSNGMNYVDALARAQRAGFAEADSSLDIEGWDAAAKTAVLANMLMGANLEPTEIVRFNLNNLINQPMPKLKSGDKLKIISVCHKENDKITAEIKLQKITTQHPFYCVDSSSSVITLKTDLMGELILIEKEPQIQQTAYAVFADMVRIIECLLTEGYHYAATTTIST